MNRKIAKGMLAAGIGLLFMAGHGSANSAVSPVEQKEMDKIGTWDGVTSTYQLKGNYIDWEQQNVPFGTRSFYAAPWRSYMDTRDAPSLLNALSINYETTLKTEHAEAISQALQEAGFKSVRLEIPWKEINFDDEFKLNLAAEEALTTVLNAFKKHGLRPLILLNANSGLPAPYKFVNVTMKNSASAGDKVIYVKDVSSIRPGYTGLQGQNQAMYPVITAVDPATGKCTLSDELKANVNIGSYELIQLKYQPFSGSKFSNGLLNPSAEETNGGWLKYVATLTKFLKGKLGTPSDAGFDLEVWNEYSFGSEFLDINNYYNPPLQFSEYITYSEGGTKTGSDHILPAEIILPLTANYVKAAKNQLLGVRVISGFSNQRPWDNGTDVWTNQDGFSRHYYTEYNSNGSIISSKTVRTVPTINALGQEDTYVPTHMSAFPEFWFDAYQTEYMVRDTQPFPGPFPDHYRYSNSGDGKEAELWMTETNFVRTSFANELIDKKGLKPTDPALIRLIHNIQTKALLRSYVFLSHKGVKNIFSFAVNFQGDLQFAVIPDAFFERLDQNGNKLDAQAKQLLGPQIQAVTNLSHFMKSGMAIQNTRKVNVDNIIEYKPRIVFSGDGTPQHPKRYHADDFTVLPYQLNDHQFAIGYYVMTRNLTHSWDKTKNELDPSRYAMPDQQFEMTLSNIAGKGAAVSAYDPITNTTTKMTVTNATANTLTVKVPATDYPRFLVVQEASPKPLFKDVQLLKENGVPVLSIVSSENSSVKLSWGKYPIRETGTLSIKRYQHFDSELSTPVYTSASNGFYFSENLGKQGETNGYFRITGKIRPKYSEKYTFVHAGDSCESKLYINGTQIMDPCQSSMQASIDLKAGKDYNIELVTFYTENYSPHSEYLYWFSKTQPFSIVPAKSDTDRQMTVMVTKDRQTKIPLPKMKAGDGVKLEMSSEGITLNYPQWDYDVRGVLYR
jgi:hypothetical protein